MEVVGEAADWSTTLAQAPISHADMLLIDWELLPNSATAALKKLRKACPAALVIILISYLGARHKAAQSAGADTFISKCEMPERLAEMLASHCCKHSNLMILPVVRDLKFSSLRLYWALVYIGKAFSCG